MSRTNYISWLRRRQELEDWSDARMASELGVSKTHWYYISSGQREPGAAFLRAAMRRFPEYDPWLLEYMRERAEERGSDDSAPAHATAQAGR
jgi:transcriptional regulator with XRE-family HTH domain